MAAAFLYRDWVASAAFIGDLGTAALNSLPLSNLTDPQPRVRARWVPGEASVYVDFGAAREISCVAVIGSSFGTTAGFPIGPNVRVRVGPDAGFGTSAWDTGFVSVDTSTAIGGNIVLVHPTSATGRYMRVDIDNSTDEYLDVGRLVAGALWRMAYAPAYGITEGRLILDRRDRNGFTGAEFSVPAVVNPRATTFTAPLITNAEAIGEWRQMRDLLGGHGDALWIPDDGLSQAELNARCIWGAVQQPGESLLARVYAGYHSRTFSIVERV